MLWLEKQINWNDFPVDCKRGAACYCVEKEIKKQNSNGEISVKRKRWIVDKDIPIFTQNRDFIESRLLFDNNNY